MQQQKLDSFLQLLEESDVADIINEELGIYRQKNGRPSYNPYRLLATIIYGFSQNAKSLRQIEERLNYDIRYMYLMEEEKPSYVTISKFLNNVVVKHSKYIYTCILKTLIKKYNICIDDVIIDGTKMEANANKYNAVWKPTTYHNLLQVKVNELLRKYFKIPESKEKYISTEILSYLNDMAKKCEKEGIDITMKTGRGIRTPPLLKDYITLYKYMVRCLNYEEQEKTCGPNRNSYYKTDKDATAMCLKEDYYSGLGSNLHAAYNIQILVSKGLILDYYVCQDRNDINTLIPLLSAFNDDYGHYPKRLCADAGYGTYPNYCFMREHGIKNYVKFGLWRQLVDGNTLPLYHFNERDELICLNNKVAEPKKSIPGRRVRCAGNNLYLIENCAYCRYQKVCKLALKNKSDPFRIFEANPDYTRLKNEAVENLLSPKGIEMRINRSAQVEGAFGIIKQDMNYTRIQRRGMENVTAEIMLVCLGLVIRKFFTIIDGTAKMEYWKMPENLEPEKLPEINYKKICERKTRYIGKNEKLRKGYKHKKGTTKSFLTT